VKRTVSRTAHSLAVPGSKLTDHDVWSPISVIGIRADGEQDDELDGEEDTGHIEKHRVHCGKSAPGSCKGKLQSRLTGHNGSAPLDIA
jgi:hypothetical protein